MKKRITILLTLVMIFSMILPQSAFADEVTDKNIYPHEVGIFFWGGYKIVDDTTIKIYWLDLSHCSGYMLSWQPVGGNETEAKSVVLKRTDNHSDDHAYTITGLKPNTEYKIQIRGILKNSEGNVYTKTYSTDAATFVTAPEYGRDLPSTKSDSIELTWKVREKDAVLKVYRSNSKDGSYEYIGSADGTGDKWAEFDRNKDNLITYTDTAVTAGKTYYYKARTEVSVGEKVQSSSDSEVVSFSAKNWEKGNYTAKLLSKKGAYTKTLKWKIKSDEVNYDTVIKASDRVARLYDKYYLRYIASVYYSFDGKKYIRLKGDITLKPGETIYVKFNLNGRGWVRKDKKGWNYLNVEYNQGNRRAEYDGEFLVLEFDDKGYLYPGYPEKYDPSLPAEFTYWTLWMDNKVTLDIVNNAEIKLSWILAGSGYGYHLRYGKTKDEAKNSEPICLPSWQIEYVFDNLERDTGYCFLIAAVDEDGREGAVETVYGRIATRPNPRISEMTE